MSISKKYIFLNFQFFLTFAISLFLGGCNPFGIPMHRDRMTNRIVNQQQQGKWITYIDSTHSKYLSKGRFKKGIPVGKWIYNTPKGELDRIEIYRGSKIKIRHYPENGKLAIIGKARIVNEKTKLHFYYYGQWKYYSPQGDLEKTAWFENGKLIEEKYSFNSGSSTYDSLVAELRSVDLDYVKYRDTLYKLEKAFGKTSEKYKELKLLDQKNDSLVLIRIDRIMKRFGYPSKEKVGESNGVIFFIVSSSSWQVKEKYLEAFRLASIKGDITIKDLAYFEDKFFVAKEGYQLYGTQYKRLLDYSIVNYPVKDLSNLNERRKTIGLDAVNLLDYSEKK